MGYTYRDEDKSFYMVSQPLNLAVGVWRWSRSGVAVLRRIITRTLPRKGIRKPIGEARAPLLLVLEPNCSAVTFEFDMDRKFINIILLGFAFMFVFTAFQTMGIIEQTVINSIKEEWKNEGKVFTGDGYISLAIVYAVFSAANWIAPSVIALLGPKYSMLIGAVIYAVFIGSFLYPLTWLLYLCSVLLGVGAAIIWTAQGNYLTVMSDEQTMSRNSGIFWAQLQCSLLFGNLFCFFKFSGERAIDKDTRELVFTVFLVLTGVGMLFMLVLQRLPRSSTDAPTTPTSALKNSFKLFFTKDMLLLCVTFFYTGIELSFFSGVYSTCVGFTAKFGDMATSLVGLSGLFIGVGEILGGATFGIFGKKTIKFGRDPIIILGFLVHMLAFFLTFLNLPDRSPFGKTADDAYIESNEYLALFCSFLLGLGDSCFNTQIYSILGTVYSDNSAPAFALFKFTQSFSAAACFFYSPYVSLYWQLLILVIFLVAGTVTFCLVEWKSYIQRAEAKPTADFDTTTANRHGEAA